MSGLTDRPIPKKAFFSADNLLSNDKIYILPNRFGMLYMLVILIMILTGATYANNLIYLLGFFLFSVFVSGMVQTHSNINGVELQVTLIEDTYEDDPVKIYLVFKNRTKKTKQTLRAQLSNSDYQLEIPAKADIVESHKSASAVLEISGHKRGYYKCPKLKVYTNFPMGLFISWMYKYSEKSFYIYPKPQNYFGSKFRLIGDSEEQKEGKALDKKTDTDFREHREYRQGESYRHIDWKAYARKRPLMVKTFEGESGRQKVFDYSSLVHLNSEERLRQLSYWITESLRSQDSFQIIMPGEKSGMSHGITHAKACLQLLAVYGMTSEKKEAA